jgi:hypothetical protein
MFHGERGGADMRQSGIVNLFVRTKQSDEGERGKTLKGKKRWRGLCGYATNVPPVTSFDRIPGLESGL